MAWAHCPACRTRLGSGACGACAAPFAAASQGHRSPSSLAAVTVTRRIRSAQGLCAADDVPQDDWRAAILAEVRLGEVELPPLAASVNDRQYMRHQTQVAPAVIPVATKSVLEVAENGLVADGAKRRIGVARVGNCRLLDRTHVGEQVTRQPNERPPCGACRQQADDDGSDQLGPAACHDSWHSAGPIPTSERDPACRARPPWATPSRPRPRAPAGP